MLPREQDTIVALSSALAGPDASLRGPGRAILRLSGAEALALAATVFRSDPPLDRGWLMDGAPAHAHSGKTPPKLRPAAGWRRVRGAIAFRGLSAPAHAYVMPGPRSYTRQDIVELHLPAARPLVFEIMEALVRAGARPALPGEFTRRALLNGRISVAQAEAIGALIRAGSGDEARVYAQRLAGPEAGGEARFAHDLNDLLSLVELGLDFSQEDVEVLSRDEMHRRVRDLLGQARRAQTPEAAGEGLALGDDPRAVLAGPSNAGKSRLFNALIGRAAAIVSDVPNTTRDAVLARLESDGLTLVDTAGLAEPQPGDPTPEVLAMALDASAQAVRSADILLIALDGSLPEANLYKEAEGLVPRLVQVLGDRRPWALALVWTKADLPRPSPLDTARIEALFTARLKPSEAGPFTMLRVSSVDGSGLEELRAFLTREAQILRARVATARAAGQTAVRAAMARCAEALARAEEVLAQGLGEDAAVVELREAAHALAQCDGVLLRHDALTERLLDRIFARFCIGK